jgi:hypothetical protein
MVRAALARLVQVIPLMQAAAAAVQVVVEAMAVR